MTPDEPSDSSHDVSPSITERLSAQDGNRRDGVARDKWAIAAGIWISGLIIVVAATFRDYGMSWDEPHSARNGKLFIQWYSGFTNRGVIDEGNQRFYGSFFNGVAYLVTRVSPFGPVETIHLCIAAFGVAGIFFAYRLAASVAGSRAGLFAAAALTLTPCYYGHSFINPKDIPFAVMYLAAVYYIVQAYDHLPGLNAGRTIKLGVVFGLALGIRVAALTLFGYLGVAFVFWWLAVSAKSGSHDWKILRGNLAAVAKPFVAVIAIAWGVMLVWWPYAQMNPLANPFRGMRALSRFTDWQMAVLYHGQFFPSTALPRSYLPRWILITLPDFYLLGFLLFAAAIAVTLIWRRRFDAFADPDFVARIAFVAMTAAFPLSIALLTRPILYDAQRHFLFVIPPAAVLLGVAVSLILDMKPDWLAWVAVPALSLSAILTFVDMVRLHPYQYVYFNRSFGGLPAALGKYETDYWGVSYKEGIDWLAKNYVSHTGDPPLRVANTSAPELTGYYLQPFASRFSAVSLDDHPDIVLSTTRWNLHLSYKGQPLHVVKRVGVPLLYVIDVRAVR